MIGYLPQDHALVQAFSRIVPARRARRAPAAALRALRAAPRLSDYLPEEEIRSARGPLDRPVSGLAIDPCRVGPGMLFFYLPGQVGPVAIAAAVARGAAGVVAEDTSVLPGGSVTCVQVADVRRALALAAQRHFRFPARGMTLAAVAGGPGRTSTAHLLKHLLNGDQRVGLIGSIHYELGARTVPSFASTPEPLDLVGMLAQMREAGCRHAVLELDDAGLAQGRAGGLSFGVAICPQVPVEAAAAEELRCFLTGRAGTAPAAAVVGLDDPRGVELAELLAREAGGVRRVTCGLNPSAQVRAENVLCRLEGTTLRLVWPGGAREVATPLVGEDQVRNLVAAVAAAWALGREPAVILTRLGAFPGVPGRMERLEAGMGRSVLVDAARTAPALQRLLRTVRPMVAGRLLVVFGCPGGGDADSRAAATRAVQAGADFAIATADNPRGEAVERIFADMQAGAEAPARLTWIADRRRAIALALTMARPGDCVVLAGKGHGGYQDMGGTVFPFDDRVVARELLGAEWNRGG